MRAFASSLFLLILAVQPQAQRAESDTAQLPVRRVILYKSGVGYFEHLGSVSGSADVAVQFTSGQLNDVLKSLTALDLDAGRIVNINYNSTAPLDERLSALRLPLGAEANPLQVYSALRGARVDVRSGTTIVTGRLLSVERRERPKNDIVETIDELTVVTDEGSVRTVALGPNVSVHIGERDLRDELSRYLALIASGRDRDVRRMVISTAGTGTRRIFVSYISEVPIWKSTYRLVLPSQAGGRPLLQGWAVVDNTVGEDWTNVELSLVAGAPQSFIQNISQPYYARRPVVPLPDTFLTTPQTHAPTLQSMQGAITGVLRDPSGAVLPGATVSLLDENGAIQAQTTTDAQGHYVLQGNPGSYRLRFSLDGFTTTERAITIQSGSMEQVDGSLRLGGLNETVTVAAMPESRADKLAARRGGGGGIVGGVVGGLPSPPPPPPPAAEAQELGDLFEYRLKEPVTIRKNQSALVPILSSAVNAERVSLWNRAVGSGRPLRAVWLTNATNLTLDGGTFSVVDANAFAGEGIIEPLKPGERRLISYATDLGVLIDGKIDDASGRVTRLVAHEGIVTVTQQERARWIYRVRNEDTTPRTLIIEHPVRSGWTMAQDPAPAEATARSARYRVAVDPKKEATLTLTERRTGDTRYAVGDIDDKLLVTLTQRGAPDATLRQALQPILEKRRQIAATEDRLSAMAAEIASINQDQQRVRENMKALHNADEEKALVQRYTRQLVAQEDRLEALRTDQRAATAESSREKGELAALIRQLTFEIGR